VSVQELNAAEVEIFKFLAVSRADVYRGRLGRVRLRRFVLAALLDVVPIRKH